MHKFLIIIRTSRLRLIKRKGTINHRHQRHTRHGLIIRHSRPIRQRPKVSSTLRVTHTETSQPVLTSIKHRDHIRHSTAITAHFRRATRARLHVTFHGVARDQGLHRVDTQTSRHQPTSTAIGRVFHNGAHTLRIVQHGIINLVIHRAHTRTCRQVVRQRIFKNGILRFKR